MSTSNSSTNTPQLTADGQLWIGSSAGGPVAATLTQGSNVTITNGHNTITIAASGGGGSGANCTTAVAQTAHGFSVGNVLQSTGTADTYQLAKADTAANAEVAGIVSAVADANDFTLLTAGTITTLSGLTTGSMYYLSDSSAGATTATPTTTAGHINKPLFYAIDTTSAVFLNMRGEVIPSASTTSLLQGSNMIMNGDFQICQRMGNPFGSGASAFAVAASTTEYCFDRWQILTNATQATTITQTKILPFQYQARIQRNSGQAGTGVMKFGTSLTGDMIAGCQGSPVTLQFALSTGANWSPTSGNITVTVQYGTNTTTISNISSSFTGAVRVISQTIAAGTSLAQTQYSFVSSSIPSTATQLSVVFSWTPTGTASTNDWVQIANVQLEIGSVANAFQRRSFAAVYEDCQHFYNKNIDGTVIPAQAVGNMDSGYFMLPVGGSSSAPVQGVQYSRNTWKAGTLTLYNPVNANAQVYDYGAAADCSTSAGSNKDNTGFELTFHSASGSTSTTSYYAVVYSVDADLT